jgi:histone deacetylase 1/2
MGEQADKDARAEAIQKEKDVGLKERTEEDERAEAETEAKAEK